MKNNSHLSITVLAVIVLIMCSCQQANGPDSMDPLNSKKFEPTWESLKRQQTPQWLQDGKFGIYTHWGVYAVHAMGNNATWYSERVYNREDSWERKDFEEKYGKLSDGVGYKDLIPMFTAEKFDADEWADLFEKAGAKFAGPVAEHHDGFAMWDTEFSDWNSAKMGPKRDIVGELETAIKAKDMKFVTAFHHAASWSFFPVWDDRYDCSNPEYSGLYGPIHEEGAEPTKEFIDEWYGKIIEVIDNYDPDFIWFDFAFDMIREDYRKKFVAYYYNKAIERGKEVLITYKGHDIPPGVAMLDLELGQQAELTYHEWITDSSVDDQGAWGFVAIAGYKSVNRLIDNLIDRVSKNGYLLLNVGPKADGTIPEEAEEKLLGMGEWLDVNGEAIYGTSAWTISGEGPTELGAGSRNDFMFNESDAVYTSEDIRFTVKGDVLYAIVLDWPAEECLIKTFADRSGRRFSQSPLYKNEIRQITMLGDGEPLDWSLQEEGLLIKTPDEKPCDHAYVFKIERQYN